MPTPLIHCPNPSCQAPNPESHRFCQQCRSPIPKRYLWAVGKDAQSLRTGELLAGRYWVKSSQIVLDTYPGLQPTLTEEISAAIDPYLRLSPYRIHVPQIYGVVELASKRAPIDLLLLEQAAIYPEGSALEGTLMPELAEAWKASSALRQLNWLRQIAHLWQPLAAEGVAATLLSSDLLRVDGAIVHLLELRPVGREAPELAELGQMWRRWQPKAQPDIADFLGELCQQVIRGEIQSAEQLVARLDRAISVCAQAIPQQIQLATRTDQGPTRQRNEDACYPPGGTVQTVNLPPTDEVPLVIVCDGIGGHEGGSVASNLAIQIVHQQLQPILAQREAIAVDTLTTALERAVLAANDVISSRNDAEYRQDRERMGTTLVMALVQNHELFLAHVGDSRAYRITRTGCQQVTVDDDLASREVRLGYALYREALQHPGSGALVQALGMGASNVLHPTVQRFVLDEDCVFLLCSDGLSDHDRVDELWHTEIAPILDGKLDVATASQRLVTLANQQNGHDNVTIGLLYCKASGASAAVPRSSLATALATPSPTAYPVTEPRSTQLLPQRRSSSFLTRLLGILLLWSVGIGALYWLIPDVRGFIDPLLGLRPEPPAAPVTVSPSVQPTTSPTIAPQPLAIGDWIEVTRSLPDGAGEGTAIVLLPQPDQPAAGMVANRLPVGSILQLLSRRDSVRGTWLELKVCSVSAEANPTFRIAPPGQTGWVLEATIAPLVAKPRSLSDAQTGRCTTPPPPAASPSPPPGTSPTARPSSSVTPSPLQRKSNPD